MFSAMEHDQVCDPATFAQYVAQLRAELSDRAAREKWENMDLSRFLEAMSAWAASWPEAANSNPWRHAADILTAAIVYE